MKRTTRKRKRIRLSFVHWILLYLAIMVLLVSMLVMYLLSLPYEEFKFVVFPTPEKVGSYEWKINVTSNLQYELNQFKVLVKNETAVLIPAFILVKDYHKCCNVDNNILVITFTDNNNDGKLSASDYFTFRFSSTPRIGNTYTIALLWADGDKELTYISFTT